MLLAGLVVIILAAGGATMFMTKGRLFHSVQHGVARQASQMLHPPIILGIPSIVSNLDNGDGRPVYVKLTAKVEISGARDEASLQNMIPRVQDIFQTYLHETRPQDIRGDGIYRLREAIIRRLRAELTPLQVTNLYLVEFLIQ
ncbi:flagellar basal body-associated FliL family protein [Gluconacetobacter sacchari]|nr:flagellar basal body-associated FliL family protein [Gluconacetobacter sacchari]GBQ18853.1 flagellar FliL protein [Gluconacetobacter sacchari DSM 12717]